MPVRRHLVGAEALIARGARRHRLPGIGGVVDVGGIEVAAVGQERLA